MWVRKYIIGPREACECPWCAMPLGNTEEALEIISEEEDYESGFCSRLCAKNWLDEKVNAVLATKRRIWQKKTDQTVYMN